ncbi:hypothetical protein SDC9_153495 [bioreactor metagenome]|uniref:Uncharacterized protein n=1 Tax=bioreactor metagenome TaxID=1076179 RepID=A0A645EYI8_9ZZZZ
MDMAHKAFHQVKEPVGHLAFAHDIGGKDKHRHRQQNKRRDSGNQHLNQQLRFYVGKVI